jgi:hypothetical protein
MDNLPKGQIDLERLSDAMANPFEPYSAPRCVAVSFTVILR